MPVLLHGRNKPISSWIFCTWVFLSRQKMKFPHHCKEKNRWYPPHSYNRDQVHRKMSKSARWEQKRAKEGSSFNPTSSTCSRTKRLTSGLFLRLISWSCFIWSRAGGNVSSLLLCSCNDSRLCISQIASGSDEMWLWHSVSEVILGKSAISAGTDDTRLPAKKSTSSLNKGQRAHWQYEEDSTYA